jgi:outer membrane receptor protein involved in Fe transport
MSSSKLTRNWLLAAAALPALALPSFAQEAAAPAEEENAGDIVVFAQKREQRVQDIPVAVAVFNAQTLQDAGVRDIKELTALTPGLLVTSTSNESVTTARIRGVGTVGDNPGLESSVGVVIDGVYRPRNGVGFGDLGEIERIEVLKGPQGTLFGKNTSAGVIQVFSKRPSFDFGANAELTFGNYNAVGAAGSVTGPLIEDTVAARIYAAARARDGFLDVRTVNGPRTKNDDNDQGMSTVRGQLLIEPSPDFSLNLIADFSNRDESCCLGVTIPSPNDGSLNAGWPNQTATRPGNGINTIAPATQRTVIPPNPFQRLAFANRDTTQKTEDSGVSAEISWDLGFATLASVTASRSWELKSAQDSDFTALDVWYRPFDGRNGTKFETLSQELRLQGNAGPLDWLIGAFYAEEDLSAKSALLYGSDYGAFFISQFGAAPALLGITPANAYQLGNGAVDVHTQNDRTLAVFTHNTLKLSDAFEVTLGLRYTDDEKNVTSRYTTTGGTCATALAGQAGLVGALGAATAGTILGNLCTTWANNAYDAVGALRQSQAAQETTGTLKAVYRFSPEIMTYASFARGYKAGGFNLDREQQFISPLVNPATFAAPGFRPCANVAALAPGAFRALADCDTSFAPETVDSYELGVKSTLMGGDMLLNFSVFRNEFQDFQLNTFLGTNFVVTSVPEVTSEGFEGEFFWATPVDGFTINGSLNYSDTKYGPWATAPQSAALLPNNTMSFAPKWSVAGGVAYERPVQNLRLRTSLNGRWVDDYSTASDLLPAKDQQAFALFNGRIGLGSQDERWTLELWSQNLFDEKYIQVGFNTPLQGSVTGAPAGAPRPALGFPGVTPGIPAGGAIYDPRYDTITYSAFLGAPRTVGVTLRFNY